MLRYLWIAGLVLVLDQASKLIALQLLPPRGSIELLPFLNLTLVYNTGAAFGFLSNAGGWQHLLFIGVAAVVSIVILVMVKRLGPKDIQVVIALMLVLGGAVGNVADRLRLGYVVDFIDVYYRAWHWPAFNVADSAITIGAVLLLLDAVGVRLGRDRAR